MCRAVFMFSARGRAMHNDEQLRPSRDLHNTSFINKLYMRSTLVPVKTGQGNECILVDLKDCSTSFLQDADSFFVGSDRFRLLIRGVEYYVEVLYGDSFGAAYQKSIM